MQSPGLPPMPTLRVIDPRRARRQRLILAGLWVASLLVAYVVGRYVMIPDAGGLSAQLAETRTTLDALRQRLADAEQRLAIVERAEQIARLANENVQAALAGKDREINRLTRDLNLYNRLVGPQAERRGLAVQELELMPAGDGSVAFSATLTQTQDVTRGSEGRLTLHLEGQRNGQLQRLDWPDMAGPDAAEGLPFEFRYFQRVDGRFMLPDDFQPHTVRVRLQARNGEPVERTLRWNEVLARPANQGN